MFFCFFYFCYLSYYLLFLSFVCPDSYIFYFIQVRNKIHSFLYSFRRSLCWCTCLAVSVRTAPSWFWARCLSWRTGDRSWRGAAVSLVHKALKSDVRSQCLMCVMCVVAASLRLWLSCATKETRRDVLSFRGKQTRRRSLSCSPPTRCVCHQRRASSSDGFKRVWNDRPFSLPRSCVSKTPHF